MGYQRTNQSPVKPVCVAGVEDTSTPRKASTFFNSSQQPQSVSSLFRPTPLPQTPQPHSWVSPPQLSPTTAFLEVKDINMSEVSPLRVRDGKEDAANYGGKEEEDSSRLTAIGGLRRASKQRTRRFYHQKRAAQIEDDGPSSPVDKIHEGETVRHLTHTSNRYTLNMPSHPAPQSDTPYVLLGYLHFLFHLSLILIFLYLIVQFILTVQKDMESRISEYSRHIITEIRACAWQHKINHCSSNAIPMALNQQCQNWEACMNRDPRLVGRAKGGAELVAGVINSYVESISWKTLIFTLTSLACLTAFIKIFLPLPRPKHQPNSGTVHQFMPPFATNNPEYVSPAAGPNWERYRWEQNLESPTKRRGLEGGIAAKNK